MTKRHRWSVGAALCQRDLLSESAGRSAGTGSGVRELSGGWGAQRTLLPPVAMMIASRSITRA